jgi:hypothetical protein
MILTKTKCIIIAIWTLIGVNSPAQTIELKYVELLDNMVVLQYDLLDSVEGRFFIIRLYHSKDNYLNPLEKITGDMGIEVRPGLNKKIVWDAREELGELFDGSVALEIRGRVFVPFINVEQINHYKVFKRGRKYALTWSGGTPQNILNFDLFNKDQKVLTFPNVANVGHHQFEFPVHLKPGKSYRFRVSDTKNRDDVVYSQPFQVKRKVPLLLKVIPATLAATALGIFFVNRSGTEEDQRIGSPIKPD